MTSIRSTVEVDRPIRTVYNQWTQFEEFPHFMGGVEEVAQLDDVNLHWRAEIAGIHREWDARIVEQTPDLRVAWASTDGAHNTGAVSFQSLTADRTAVTLELDFEPEGFVEKVGDSLGLIERRAENDLLKFKEFIEDAGYETGAWRGRVDGDTTQ